MKLRPVQRAMALLFVLVTSILRFWLMRLRSPMTLAGRAYWLHRTCIRVLRSVDIRCEVEGSIPTCGLVISNHLSYLDIAVVGAVMPCFFVAKAEIDRWPYFGRAARFGGTISLHRSSRSSAVQVSAIMSERLELSIPLLLFPEGTSTDGKMLRFHSRLFQPAIEAGSPITAASIGYVVDDGTPERELCWFGADTFAPHLLKTLQLTGVQAKLQFGKPRVYPNRRIAADETFREVAAMRAGAREVRETVQALQPA